MPRYVVERTFPDGLRLPPGEAGDRARLLLIDNNAELGITWVHSYVTLDKRKSFCIYDAPSPETIRRAARHNGLPIDRISEVGVLEPYVAQ